MPGAYQARRADVFSPGRKEFRWFFEIEGNCRRLIFIPACAGLADLEWDAFGSIRHSRVNGNLVMGCWSFGDPRRAAQACAGITGLE